MKLSPTLTLALALAAGVAGAAVAQTSITPGTPATNPPSTQTTAPTGSALEQTTPSYSSSQTNPNAATQAYGGQVQNNANEQVRSAQQELHQAGLYNGPTDGLMDPDTMAAIARFQQQHGLKVTQMLDQQTLDLLLGNKTMGMGSGSQGTTGSPAGAGGLATPGTTGQAPAR